MKPKLTAILILSAIALIFIFYISIPDGRELIIRLGCRQCHRINNQGGFLAPELSKASKSHSYLWLRAQIKDPRKNNPHSPMPSYDYLSEAEIYSIIRYLRSNK